VTRGPAEPRTNWLIAIRLYLVAIALGNLLWETAQLPLYTLWRTGTPATIAAAVLHCTLGDLLIGTIALIAALAVVGSPAWPAEKGARVAIATAIIGVGYTVYSEYMNTSVRNLWAYTEWMPTLPWLRTGLAPLAQWVVIPPLALLWTGRYQPLRAIPLRQR
jgi:hypothetical protein